MKDQTKRKRELKKHIEDSLFNLYECAVITSVNVKRITANLAKIIDDKDTPYKYDTKSYISSVLALRSVMAQMDVVTCQFVPLKEEELNNVYKRAYTKLEAAQTIEKEFNDKYYLGCEAELEYEDILKCFKNE